MVGAPDQLHVTILPDPAIERDVVVRPDGMISIDLIGDVPAAGRSVGEIASDVEQRIARFKRGAAVTVSLVAAASNSITVLGEVHAPQSFALLKQMRVAEAIAVVGGPISSPERRTASGSCAAAAARRSCIWSTSTAIQGGDLRTNIVLAEGDIVYVPPTCLGPDRVRDPGDPLPVQPAPGPRNDRGRGRHNAVGPHPPGRISLRYHRSRRILAQAVARSGNSGASPRDTHRRPRVLT